ncbi:MAG: methionyl-tRNA formyltransferase [Gammaproteobacteria bacterium]|nr:methionyl-tRNA formyltransferase [Gammaproteobacteria bacterium]
MTQALKIIYAGTPEFAAEALQALIAAGHQIICVYTQPDRPAGRGRKLTPSAVKQAALNAGIEVRQPLSLKKKEDIDALAALNADLMIVAAYGLILPKAVLDAPRLGCINIHASLLPAWRGAAPIQRAIINGDAQTGITIMQMDVGLDTGDMLLIKPCDITASDTASTLHDKLAQLGAQAVCEAVPLIAQGKLTAEKQDNSLATYAHKLQKEEANIDWNKSAVQLDREIRAFNPWPISQTTLDGEVLRIWQAQTINETSKASPGSVIRSDKKGIDVATGDGVLRLLQVQLPGGKPQPIHAFVNAHNVSGKQFGLPA